MYIKPISNSGDRYCSFEIITFWCLKMILQLKKVEFSIGQPTPEAGPWDAMQKNIVRLVALCWSSLCVRVEGGLVIFIFI